MKKFIVSVFAVAVALAMLPSIAFANWQPPQKKLPIVPPQQYVTITPISLGCFGEGCSVQRIEVHFGSYTVATQDLSSDESLCDLSNLKLEVSFENTVVIEKEDNGEYTAKLTFLKGKPMYIPIYAFSYSTGLTNFSCNQ